MIKRISAFVFLTLAGCDILPGPVDRSADMLVVGDSLFAWHRTAGQSIPDVIAARSGISVSNVALSGAPFIGFAAIPNQYVRDDWIWVLVDGGGNDLLRTCGDPAADRATIDALITADATDGAFVRFAERVVADGAQLIIMGYYPISVAGGPLAACPEALADLGARQALLAKSSPRMTYVDTGAVISPDNLAAYDADLLHPSVLGSALIGAQIAGVLEQ